jgi:hypothetical protein
VTANRLEEEIPQELAKYGTRVDVITAEQIKDGGFVDIAQALETLAPVCSSHPRMDRSTTCTHLFKVPRPATFFGWWMG